MDGRRELVVLGAAIAALVSACSLQRATVDPGGPEIDARVVGQDGGERDGGPPLDEDAGPPPGDGGSLDGGSLDGGPRDGGSLDGGPPDGGPPDGGPGDAGPGDSGSDACAGATESCDGLDEDCDGRVDEGAGDCGCDRVLRDDGRSYLFCTGALERDPARAACVARGYDLVVIDDAAENAFVRGEIMPRGSDFLIGLDDGAVEREFRWVDGRVAWRDGTALLYTNWRGGQPDDWFGEDCVEMGSSGTWNDIDCEDDRRYACESPAP